MPEESNDIRIPIIRLGAPEGPPVVMRRAIIGVPTHRVRMSALGQTPVITQSTLMEYAAQRATIRSISETGEAGPWLDIHSAQGPMLEPLEIEDTSGLVSRYGIFRYGSKRAYGDMTL